MAVGSFSYSEAYCRTKYVQQMQKSYLGQQLTCNAHLPVSHVDPKGEE